MTTLQAIVLGASLAFALGSVWTSKCITQFKFNGNGKMEN